MTRGIVEGALLGLLCVFVARRMGRREPRFWAAALVVMQAVYLVFALVGPDAAGLVREGLLLVAFLAVAVAALRISAWFLPLGLLAHGLWDLRHLLVREDYVFPFYAELCVGFDWLVFVYVLISAPDLERRRKTAAPEEAPA